MRICQQATQGQWELIPIGLAVGRHNIKKKHTTAFSMTEFITTHITDIVGYGASLSMILGYLPQAVHTMRTRKTDDIALGTFLFMGLGGLLFAVQGLMLPNWPLFLCNLVTTSMSAVILAIKLHNDYFGGNDKRRK